MIREIRTPMMNPLLMMGCTTVGRLANSLTSIDIRLTPIRTGAATR